MKALIFILGVLIASNAYVTQDESHKDSRKKIFELINRFRKENGLPELEYAWTRQVEINLWAKHLERNFEHARSGYACENIAVNFDGAEELFNQWKNSPPHRRNMLLPAIKYCAIGIHEGTFQGHEGAMFGVFRGYNKKLKAL